VEISAKQKLVALCKRISTKQATEPETLKGLRDLEVEMCDPWTKGHLTHAIKEAEIYFSARSEKRRQRAWEELFDHVYKAAHALDPISDPNEKGKRT
jgi:hypothetical protein